MPLVGTCHCKATRFEVDSPPTDVKSCTCSICSRRGALWAYYTPDQVKVVSEASGAIYQWQSELVKFHHCAVCGCTTYNAMPDFSMGKPDLSKSWVAVNARLFENCDLTKIPVEVIDGKNLW